MPSSGHINTAIESVSVTDGHMCGVFDVIVMSKSGISSTLRLGHEEILREYGAYLTVGDRHRVASSQKQGNKRKFCAIM